MSKEHFFKRNFFIFVKKFKDFFKTTHMDIVTKSFIDQFKDQYGYNNLEDSQIFELFSIYCIASKYIRSETINKDLLDDLNIGNGGDWGIDGFLLIVNGRIVTSIQEIDDLLLANNSLQIKIIVIQAKTSEQFKVNELGQELDGIEYILKEIYQNSKVPNSNKNLDTYRNIIKHIYSKSAYFDNGENPKVILYYVTCGEYKEQKDHDAKIDKTKESIEKLGLTSLFKCKLLGKKDIINLYKETKSKIETTIKVNHKIPLPDIKDVEESYLCLIPFSEFKKLIIDEDKINKAVFYDNIRAFQGDNVVNRAMASSLKERDINLFSAMNNGITVIAKKLKATGTNMLLSDYQIVNGCQTSHVLFENQNLEGIDNLMLTVKIVSSNNKEIRDKIIIGNNSQTEVKREQLVSLLDTQKMIEDYYNAQTKYEKLYYERRSKQYRFEETKIPSYKIITIPFQIQAFIAMILGKPHMVRGYYGSIVDRFDKTGIKVFGPDTHPALYYTSALACFKMTECFSHKIIDSKYKKIKFHLLLAFRLMCEKSQKPNNNRDAKIQEYCDHLCNILCDKKQNQKAFESAVKMLDTILQREPLDSDGTSKDLTDALFKLSHNLQSNIEAQQMS